MCHLPILCCIHFECKLCSALESGATLKGKERDIEICSIQFIMRRIPASSLDAPDEVRLACRLSAIPLCHT